MSDNNTIERPYHREALSFQESMAVNELLHKLTRKDIREIGSKMTDNEARLLVDYYYISQSDRLRFNNQVRQMADEPNLILSHMAAMSTMIESLIQKALDDYTAAHPVAGWMRRIFGIGPVISAGFLAHIDITKAETAGHIWAYCGMNPGQSWEKGQKRPWNATLKTLCCAEGTTITTKFGPKPIEQVVVGDVVLTHKGNWKPVTQTHQNHYFGNMTQARVFGLGLKGPCLTDGHPVLVKKPRVHRWTEKTTERPRFRLVPRSLRSGQLDDSDFSDIKMRLDDGQPAAEIARLKKCSQALISKIKHGYVRGETQDKEHWVAAEKVDVGHTVLAPTPPISNEPWFVELEDLPGLHKPAKSLSVQIDHDLSRVIGMYIGDGHSSKNSIHWSFGPKEMSFAKFVCDVIFDKFGIRPVIAHAGNVIKVSCYSKQLMRWFDANVGKYSHHKRVPSSVFAADEEVIAGMIAGLFDSDGNYANRIATFTSVNYHIATSLRQLLSMMELTSALTLFQPSIGFGVQNKGDCLAYTLSVNNITAFYERIFKQKHEHINTNAAFEWDDRGSWHVVSGKNTDWYNGTVYNLEVEDDNSYVADGVAVHNCYKAGESFVKTCNSEKSFYGKLYKERKEWETAKNLAGDYKEQAAREILRMKDKTTVTYKALSEGRLSDGHIHARARRWAVKLFLSHLHQVMYEAHYGVPAPMPFAKAILNHAHVLTPQMAIENSGK